MNDSHRRVFKKGAEGSGTNEVDIDVAFILEYDGQLLTVILL